jgi:hypothetical protein
MSISLCWYYNVWRSFREYLTRFNLWICPNKRWIHRRLSTWDLNDWVSRLQIIVLDRLASLTNYPTEVNSCSTKAKRTMLSESLSWDSGSQTIIEGLNEYLWLREGRVHRLIACYLLPKGTFKISRSHEIDNLFSSEIYNDWSLVHMI